jgi:hypothetical protein
LKECIFCGKNPESQKTKEHVFPQWLIEFTNNSNKSGNFGFNLSSDPPEPRTIPFKSFTFPACDECNQQFKILENNASKIIKKMSTLNDVTELEFSTLLDWLDKIRIGLLLGFNMLDRKELEVKPSFFIGEGIGLFDRMLMINRVEDSENYLSARGCDTLLFRIAPNCFLLIINNLYLLSISTNQLFSRRLGFPYYTKAFYEEEINKFTVVLGMGSERIMYPLIRKPFILKSIELYQPMFPQRSFGKQVKHFESNYVKERSLDWQNGIGRIFINKNKSVQIYENESDWVPEVSKDRWDLTIKASKQVFQMQIDLLKTIPSMERLSKKRMREINTIHKIAIMGNRKILRLIDSGLI